MINPNSKHVTIDKNEDLKEKLKPSSIWVASKSKTPEIFNSLYDFYAKAISNSNCRSDTKKRFYKADETGEIVLYVKGFIHNMIDNSINVGFIIAHGPSKSNERKKQLSTEEQWWSLSINQFVDYFDYLYSSEQSSANFVDKNFRKIK
jgi:hypothetical protein